MNPQPYPNPPGQPYAAIPPPRRSRTLLWVLIGGGVLLAAGITVFLVVTLTGSSQRPLAVKFGLVDFNNGSSCDGGRGGYRDIGPGMPITVRNQDNRVVGSTQLTADGEEQSGPSGRPAGCIWHAVVVVPDDEEQYVIEGGDRGQLTYSRAELEAREWAVEMGISP